MTEPVSADLAGTATAPAPALLPAPGFPSLLSQTLAALLRGPTVFAHAAAAETPPLWSMAANILVFSAAGQGTILILRSVGSAGAGEAAGLALFHCGAAAAALAGSFVLALAVDVIARLSDSDADYLRSYQIVSLSSGVALAGTAAYALPVLWFIPTAWASFLVGTGIQKMHRALPSRAWTIIGLLAAAALGGQWYGMRQYRTVVEQTRSAGAAISEMQRLRAELERSLPALQPADLPESQRPEAAKDGQGGAAVPQPLAGPDGKDPFLSPEALVLPPGVPSSPDGPAPAIDPAQTQASLGASLGMIRSLIPMLTNPQVTKSMPPAQAKVFRDLARTLENLERSASAGKPPSDADMAKIFQALMSLQLQAGPAPGAPGSSRGPQKSPPPRTDPASRGGKP